MINYNYTCRADSLQGTRQVGAQQAYSVITVRTINRQEVTPDDAHGTSHQTHARRAAPVTSPITLGWQPSIDEVRGRPSQDRSDIPPQEGPSTMSPHSDRCTSKAKVSPDQDQPDTANATLSSCRPVIHRSTGSIRGVRRAHHRAQPAEIICNREDQNHPPTDSVKGISGNSGPGEVPSSCQYWGRRRYGPIQ